MVIPKSLNVQFNAHTPTLLPWTVGVMETFETAFLPVQK